MCNLRSSNWAINCTKPCMLTFVFPSLASQAYFSPRAHARLISGWRREGKIRLVTIDRISFLAARNLCGQIRAQRSCDNNTCCVTLFTITLRIIVDRKTRTQCAVKDTRRCTQLRPKQMEAVQRFISGKMFY